MSVSVSLSMCRYLCFYVSMSVSAYVSVSVCVESFAGHVPFVDEGSTLCSTLRRFGPISRQQ